MKDKNLNTIIKVIFWLWIAQNFTHMILSIFTMFSNTLNPDPHANIISFIQGLIIIIILFGMVYIKKWALYSFYAYQLLNFIFVSLINGNVAESAYTSIFSCVIMSAILFIRKNGVSGWKTFLDNIKTA